MKYLPRPIRKNSDLSILLLLVLVLFLIVASLMFPPSAHAGWNYLDPLTDPVHAINAYGSGNVGFPNMIRIRTYDPLNPGVLCPSVFVPWNALGDFYLTSNNCAITAVDITSLATQPPAPTGYYTQSEYDAAGGASTFQMDFDVPTYSALVGFFLGLFVLAYGAGAVYRLFVGRRY